MHKPMDRDAEGGVVSDVIASSSNTAKLFTRKDNKILI